MLSKNKIKQLKSLHVRKFRNEQQQFIAEGPKVVEELLISSFDVLEVFATASWLEANAANLHSVESVEEVSEKELERISALRTPNEVFAVVAMPGAAFDPTKSAQQLLIGLENLRDPGNLGTIIRIADWFGIDTILTSHQSVEVWNPKVVQASMGSVARVSVVPCELKDVIAQLKSAESSFPIYGTVLGGSNIYQTKLEQRGLLLFGNESAGLSKPLADVCSDLLTIPSFGGAESLNAATAAAVVCSEFRRADA